MQAKEKLEKPLKWFVLPNESYKWDFILEKYVVEDSQQEGAAESAGNKQLADDGFDKDFIIAHKRLKQRDRYYY
jgi:hypothetical protein